MPMVTERDARAAEWLNAERAGRVDDADERFRSVARVLDRFEMPRGFAAAVAARVAEARRVPDVWSAWWTRAAIAASVLSAGAAAAALPAQGWFRAGLASLQSVALGLGDASAAAWAWIAGALAVWSGLGRAAAVVGRQMAGPEPVFFLALQFVLAAGAFAALRRLTAGQEH